MFGFKTMASKQTLSSFKALKHSANTFSETLAHA